MRTYEYATFIEELDEYGQQNIKFQGTIKIAIYTSSQSIQDNIRYKDATYIGLTQAKVDDTFVINYNGELLKVLYVNPKGRYKQVFMKNII